MELSRDAIERLLDTWPVARLATLRADGTAALVPVVFVRSAGRLWLPVDGKPKREAGAAIDALVRQVSSPVLWEDIMHRLASEGVTTYVEVGPGTVLGGLVKKIHPDARIINFGSPEQLDAVMAACSI